MGGGTFDPRYQALASVDNDVGALRSVKKFQGCSRSPLGMLRRMFGACVDQESPIEGAELSQKVAQVSFNEVRQPLGRRASALNNASTLRM